MNTRKEGGDTDMRGAAQWIGFPIHHRLYLPLASHPVKRKTDKMQKKWSERWSVTVKEMRFNLHKVTIKTG